MDPAAGTAVSISARPERPLPAPLQRMLYAFLWVIFQIRGLCGRLTALLRPPRAGCAPAHVALAGALESSADVARLALAAERAGAGRFSVCAHNPIAIEKACAAAGVQIPVLVRPPEPRGLIVQTARRLACTKPADRDVDAADPYAVMRHLDRVHMEEALPTEPDVLVVVPPRGGQAVCIASFSVWQLRLTQFRFARWALPDLDDGAFLELVCSATGVAKRFGR